MNLWRDFLTNDARVIHKWKHYFPIYERHFRDYVYKPVSFIEIGCGEGGSLQMWKRYFGPHARIIGLDIEPRCKVFEEDQIEIRIGEQQDLRFLTSIIDEFGAPDIVLDDGGHMMSHVCASFEFLYPRLSKSGIYMVEDLHTAYWDEHEGGLGRPGSFIERSKQLIDELNADHIREGLAPSEFTRTTQSMHFYDSIVVFERGTTTAKFAPHTGGSAAADATPAAPSAKEAALESAIAQLSDRNRILAEIAGDDSARLRSIEASTIWRASAPLRAAAAILPKPVRRGLRQAARALYWAATPHRLRRRFQLLRRRGATRADGA